MGINIAELKAMAPGTEVGGFPLLIKTARAAYVDADKLNWQDVVFIDASGEMLGQILLPEAEPNAYSGRTRTGVSAKWKSKTNLCILKATIQATQDRNKEGVKLTVTECFDTATPLTYDQQSDLSQDDWQRMRQEEIEGKIRYGILIAHIRSCKRLTVTDGEKALINKLVEFVKEG